MRCHYFDTITAGLNGSNGFAAMIKLWKRNKMLLRPILMKTFFDATHQFVAKKKKNLFFG